MRVFRVFRTGRENSVITLRGFSGVFKVCDRINLMLFPLQNLKTPENPHRVITELSGPLLKTLESPHYKVGVSRLNNYMYIDIYIYIFIYFFYLYICMYVYILIELFWVAGITAITRSRDLKNISIS